jgi:hypothetical protein
MPAMHDGIGVVTLQSNDMATVGARDFVLKKKWRIFDNFFIYTQTNTKKTFRINI